MTAVGADLNPGLRIKTYQLIQTTSSAMLYLLMFLFVEDVIPLFLNFAGFFFVESLLAMEFLLLSVSWYDMCCVSMSDTGILRHGMCVYISHFSDSNL